MDPRAGGMMTREEWHYGEARIWESGGSGFASL